MHLFFVCGGGGGEGTYFLGTAPWTSSSIGWSKNDTRVRVHPTPATDVLFLHCKIMCMYKAFRIIALHVLVPFCEWMFMLRYEYHSKSRLSLCSGRSLSFFAPSLHQHWFARCNSYCKYISFDRKTPATQPVVTNAHRTPIACAACHNLIKQFYMFRYRLGFVEGKLFKIVASYVLVFFCECWCWGTNIRNVQCTSLVLLFIL